MKQRSPCPIHSSFTLVHLEAELQRDSGWRSTLGTTSADMARARIVMVEFLNELLDDPRVQECFQRLYEKVFDVSIDNYLDHIGRYQNTIMNDLQKFIEDTLHLPSPDFPPSLEVEAAQSRLEAPLRRAKPDRLPKNLTHLRFYGRWLYQERVGKATQYKIGKAYYTEQGHESNYEESGCDCRRKARKDIDEAKRLLGPYITL